MAVNPETGTTTYSKDVDPGTTSATPATNDTPSNLPSSNGGSGGNGTSGAFAKDQQADNQQQINNLTDINLYRKGDLDKISKGREKDINAIAKDRLNDMDNIAQRELGNINSRIAQNNAALRTRQSQIERDVQWQPAEQKKQSMLMQLRNRMGNAAYGSNIQDLLEGMQRVDDMSDVSLIQAWKENQDTAYSNWLTADEQLAGDYNKLIAQILDQYSQFESDYKESLSKQNRDYQDKVSQLYSGYWSSLSNINPQVASKENMAIAKNPKKAKKTAKKVAKAANAMVRGVLNDKTSGGKTISTKGLTGVQKQAAKIVNKALKQNANKKNYSAAVTKAVKKAGKEYVKGQSTTTVGKGTNKYTLPAADLTKLAKMPKEISVKPSDTLSKMLVDKQSSSTVNPLTSGMVRTQPSRMNTQLGGNNGSINYSRAANQGFNDNLAAFRR